MHHHPPRPTGIYSLPVELITRIFVLGAGYDYPYDGTPFLLKPDKDYYAIPTSNFQLLVSQICQHWRQIALRTSCLWNILHFREPAHFDRAKAFLTRCSGQLLDITVDTVSQQDHIPGITLCREEIQMTFAIIIPYVKRWRAFHLKVRDNECKRAARQHLSTCGPAPNLETLQLYHFEDYRTSQNLYLATYRPPVMVFNNSLPRLRNVSLIGVNLPWAQSPYLAHLHNLELALHPENIRPPYEYWDQMLRNSPELQTLSLHYSGPRVENGDLVWPTNREKIYIETLKNLSLTDLDPDYLCLLMERLILPGVTKLCLDLPDQDFTPFIELLAGAKSPAHSGDPISSSLPSHPSPSTPSTLTPSSPPNGLSPVSATSTLSTNYISLGHAPFPVLSKLETLIITALECSTDSLRSFLRPLEGLRTLEVHFPRVGECFHGLFMETVIMEIEHDETRFDEAPVSEKASMFSPCPRSTSNAAPTSLNIICDPLPAPRHAQIVPLLPRLQTFRIFGLPGEKVAQLIKFRQGPWSQGVKPRSENNRGTSRYAFERVEWVVRWHERRRGKDLVLDRLVDDGWTGEDGRWVKVRAFEDEGEEEEEEDVYDGEMDEDVVEDED
ncbi:hypothetical protein BDZ94DRAFT_692607 [Collybia nuda]|uniref:F-box domain-containing protein n=1 Tax=Collybia nuda TaxID=64659 RepID=A0A9P6CQJ8_9AGAR|nr:hypothetical protein BDZ94DRAFT_692607 [Collybia nuda]